MLAASPLAQAATRQAAMLIDAKQCFLRACALDVAVQKPGNVSWASAGHGMQAAQFLASAEAAAGPLFNPGARVGRRIEAAVAATWEAVGCNTNLGILLLCAPVALAIEREPPPHTRASLRGAIESVLAGLDIDDANAAFRAIRMANPGGLGDAAAEDVHHAPTVDLRAAMALAAGRDLIARQYRDGYADLFEIGLHSLPPSFSLMAAGPHEGAEATSPRAARSGLGGVGDAATTAAVQRLYLVLLASLPDSHIVRKHGEAVAQNVMTAAQAFAERATAGENPAADPGFVAWDAELKAARINPGTTADFTVATLLIAGLLGV